MAASIFLVFAALLFVATVAGEHDGKYAYVRENIQQTGSCVAFSKTNICPNINITLLPELLNDSVQSLKDLNSSLYSFARSPNVNASASCIEAVNKQQCLGIPHCFDDGLEEGIAVDVDVAIAECKSARKLCPHVLNAVYLNCTTKEQQYKNQTSAFEKASCAIVQDPTGFCPDVKYKRYNSSLSEYAKVFREIKSAIEPLQENTTDECYKNVKALACSNLGACSDDGKYLLALYSQEDCNNTVDCIPESSRQEIKSHLCSDVPDAKNPHVKKVPYPTGSIAPSVAPTMSPSMPPTSNITSNTTRNVSSPTGNKKPTTTPTSQATYLKDIKFQLIVAVFFTSVAKHLL